MTVSFIVVSLIAIAVGILTYFAVFSKEEGHGVVKKELEKCETHLIFKDKFSAVSFPNGSLIADNEYFYTVRCKHSEIRVTKRAVEMTMKQLKKTLGHDVKIVTPAFVPERVVPGQVYMGMHPWRFHAHEYYQHVGTTKC